MIHLAKKKKRKKKKETEYNSHTVAERNNEPTNIAKILVGDYSLSTLSTGD